MNKKYELIGNKLTITFEFTDEHLRTLVIISANDGCAEFENRDPHLHEDVDGNDLSWRICDELVEMGLLDEDEESYDVFFEINDNGRNILDNYEE